MPIGDKRAENGDKNKSGEVIAILKNKYPDAGIVLNYGNPWELLVAVVLSAQTTDKQVNRVTEPLFDKYQKVRFTIQDSLFKNKVKRLEDEKDKGIIREIANFAVVKLAELQEDINSVGFYKNKAKYIKKSARMILEDYDGEIPDSIEEITKLPGVARKTGHIVIGNAYGADKVEGIAVDTHVARLSQRLRMVDTEKISGKKAKKFERDEGEALDYYRGVNTDKVERQLMEKVPKEEWFRFTYLLIAHGRSICAARSPECSDCPVSHLCPSSRV